MAKLDIDRPYVRQLTEPSGTLSHPIPYECCLWLGPYLHVSQPRLPPGAETSLSSPHLFFAPGPSTALRYY